MTRAFLFDLDGTLVDTERENAESIALVLASRGRPLSDAERDFVVGHGWREIYQFLCDAGGIDLGFNELKEASAIAKEALCEERGLRGIPGAVDFVRRAAALGPCTVVSGSSRREIDYCIRSLGLDRELPFYIGAEDVTKGKPSPEGYLLAADRLEVEPGSCVVFEDSAAGIASARAAGMRCIALSCANFLGVDQRAADLVVADFLALDEEFWMGIGGSLPCAPGGA